MCLSCGVIQSSRVTRIEKSFHMRTCVSHLESFKINTIFISKCKWHLSRMYLSSISHLSRMCSHYKCASHLSLNCRHYKCTSPPPTPRPLRVGGLVGERAGGWVRVFNLLRSHISLIYIYYNCTSPPPTV